MEPNNFFSIEEVIDRQPLTVAPETPVIEVIRRMQEWANSCYLTESNEASDADFTGRVNNSCALVVEDVRLQGIFTERDLVKLIATERDLAEIVVGEVMSRELITLTATGVEDIFTVLNLLRQHSIRHLPLIDEGDRLLGLITEKNLRQNLKPIDLMKWRRVEEVMSDRVIHALPTISLRHTAQLMANHLVSCIAIVESDKERDGLLIPVGIITERDIVQFQALNLDLAQPVQRLMSKPLFIVNPQDSLWTVHQQMQQRRVRRLLVAGSQGELQGIITQTSLLQVLDPTEMYGVIEVLQRQVCQLELGEQRFDSILSSLEDVVWSVALNTFDRLYINLAAAKIYGRQVAEFYDNPHLWLEVVHPEDRDRVSNFAQNIIETEGGEIEYRIVRPHGEIRWLRDRAHLIRDADGKPIRLDGIATDISDRQRREEILKDIASGMSVEIGANFLPSLVEYLSKTLQVDYALVGELITPEEDSIKTLAVYGKDQIIDNFEYHLAGTPCQNVVRQKLCVYPETVQQLFPDDQILQEMAAESYAGMPILDTTGQTLGLICIIDSKSFDDISLIEEVLKIFATRATVELERQKSEGKIRQQAALLDVATDAIMVRGLDNQILFWNRGAEKLYGWTQAEALERDANELLDRESPTELSEIQQVVRNKGEWQGELNQVTKAGKNIIVQSRWTLVRNKAENSQSYLVVNTDITEQKQLEAQFLRAQRLESLGTLAGGIAHDLNNILAPILGFAKLLPLKLPNVDEQTKEYFKIMETNAQRGSALVKQILTFARGLEGDRGMVQIRHLIAEIKQIIEETFPKAIELEISAPKNLWTVNGDVNQLHQVLMNLTVNARDAMPDGGKLTIKAENFTVDASYARLHLDAQQGSYVLITVADTGVGIPAEIIERIFEPFFTTKEIGRGTGLGLSTVIGIVKNHGGFVDVVSETQRGTQFKVFLPASETLAIAIEETEELPQGNGELILVVDDEPPILKVTKATLETYNYRVLTANDGIEAIALYTQNQAEIGVVLMDLMMPEMNGLTAMRTLRKINPSVKLIANSGLAERDKITTAERISIQAFLAKPYTTETLLRRLKDVIIAN